MVRTVNQRCGPVLLLSVFLWLMLPTTVTAADPAADGNSAQHGVILQYHHIAEDTPPATSLSPEVFRGHLDILAREGYTVWPLPRLVQALLDDKPVPDRTVVITFDDAYESIAKTAAPMLQERGFPFTVFVSTDYVDRRQPGYMTWQQLRDLIHQGGNLANHTRSHLHMLRRPEPVSKSHWHKRLRREVDDARQRIREQTGEDWPYFAYPYGEADGELVALIRDWGYLGFGQQSGAVDKRLLQSGMAPRFPFNEMYKDLDDFRTKASSLPLPLQEEEFSGWVFSEAVIPELTLTLEDHRGSLNCFASGQGAIRVEAQDNNVYQVQANQPIPVGRSRYNCTLPVAGQQGRFHWYSRMWMRKKPDGSWYAEP